MTIVVPDGFEQIVSYRVTRSGANYVFYYLNSASGVGVTKKYTNSFGQEFQLINPARKLSEATWMTLAIPAMLPDECTGIHLSGISIITNASNFNLDMYISGRAFGEDINYAPQLQSQAVAHGGARDSVNIYIPVKQRKLQMRYSTADTGSAAAAFTQGATVGLNLKLDGFTVPAQL